MAPAVPEFAGLTVTEADAELLLALAVTVAAVSDETVPAVTLKFALLDPDATTADAGTVNAAWFLVRVTVTPAVGAALLSVTAQPIVWPESTSELAHDSDVTVVAGATGGLMVKVTERELLLALAVRVTAVSEETVPAVTAKLALLDPDVTTTDAGAVNAAWFLIRVTVTPADGAAPLRVTVQPSVWLETTSELAHDSEVTVGGGATGGLTVNVTERELLLALAVTVTAVSEETVPAVTAKLALFAPDVTTADAGTVNAVWLSVNVTVAPPAGAALLSVTVQPSVWLETTSELAHDSDVTVGGGATGGLTVNVAERELLLALAVRITAVSDETVPAVTVKLALLDPDATTADDGTVNAAWFLVRVTVTPPDGAAPLSVTVQPSVWVEITCEAAHVSAVTVRNGALSASVKERELLLALAVRSTAVVALTADAADAVNPAVNDPDGTVTEEGIETLELFFERATACPPLGAAPLKVTVQLADPGGVSVPGVQLKLLTVGAGRGWGCEMVTVPLLPEDGIELPAADAADVFEICTTLDVAAVFEAMVRVTTATTPFAIEVVLNPKTRQVTVPASVLHETDFSAAVAAPPAVTLIAENTDEEYPVVHCKPAG